jgi:superfamily II DNA or RNA helicase
MRFELRDYQSEVIENIYRSLKRGKRSIMVQSPPRSGKTVIMAEIARRATEKGNRVLFIVHRKEIVDQVIATFEQQEVNMKLCTIGMVQTISRRVDKLKYPQIIMVDEAHHILANTYLKIIKSFPKAVKLMFTGTPYRMSGEGFQSVCDDLILGKQVSWLIENKRLSPCDYYAPKVINDKLLRIKNGEFSKQSIEDSLSRKIYGDAVKNYCKIANNTNAIAYCYSVESAKKLADEFNSQGIKAIEVDGTTPTDERNHIINQFKNGEIKVLTNVELFTEGLDLPGVDTVIQLRPTKSLSLFLQFSMRSMNYRKGKRAIIIDHVGNVERFGLPVDDREWSLKGKKRKSKDKPDVKPTKTCPQCFGTFYNVKNACPYCGYVFESETPTYKKEANVELVKVKQKKMVSDSIVLKKPSELKNMEEIKRYAKAKGYKNGWIYYQARAKGLIRI